MGVGGGGGAYSLLQGMPKLNSNWAITNQDYYMITCLCTAHGCDQLAYLWCLFCYILNCWKNLYLQWKPYSDQTANLLIIQSVIY